MPDDTDSLREDRPDLAPTVPHTPTGGSAGHAPAPGGGEAVPERVGRYRVEGEIARGGMGRVLRVRDDELGRALAVKVLLDEHRGHPELERRFLDEARLTGGLQHPGVPPVHELGRLAGGTPYFAMKLI